MIGYFAENRIAANLLMLFIFIGGLFTAANLPVRQLPDQTSRTISVVVPAPGSSPKEIEEDINRRVEDAVIGLSGVDRVISEARHGFGKIVIQIDTIADPETVLNDVTTSIEAINQFPPSKTENPDIFLHVPTIPVMTLAVSSQNSTENELRLIAEQVQRELLDLPEITRQVELRGVRDRQISIELDRQELERYNLTFAYIKRKIERESINLSLGELNTDSGNVVLHTILQRKTGAEFESIPIITKLDGSVVTLGEIATVTDGFADYQVHSELNGVPTVFADVIEDAGQSIAEIRQGVQTWLANSSFPEHVTVAIHRDRAGTAVERMSQHLSNAIIGLVIVFLFLVAIFDLRLATWITAGIPLSFIGALLLFPTVGMTINLGTIFAFFLLIGIVVDDAVVVGENIAAKRQTGENALSAAISGAKEMAWPITIGAVTTAMAFIPLLFLTSERYQFLKAIPYVVSLVLLISLIEALLILPAHLSKPKPWSLSPLADLQSRVRKSLDGLRAMVVAPIVSFCVRHTVLTPAIGIVVVVISFALIGSDSVRIILIDQRGYVSDRISVNITMPVESSFDNTLMEAQRIAMSAELAGKQFDDETIKAISIVAGVPITTSVSAINHYDLQKSSSSHIATVEVVLNDPPLRKIAVSEFERAWRQIVGDSSPADLVEFNASQLPVLPNIAYSLRHPDREVLKSATTEFRGLLESETGVFGLTDSMAIGKRHLNFEITEEGLLAGVTPSSLGIQLRASYHGMEVQRFQRKGDQISVVLQYPRDERENLSSLTEEQIHVGPDQKASLSDVADIRETRELATYSRINGENAAFVRGFVDFVNLTPLQLRQKIKKEHIPDLQEKYPDLVVEVAMGVRSELQMLKMLGIVVPLVLIAMYAICAAFLRSYWKPLIVVFGVPMSFAGAVFSHWILGWDFTTISIFGVIAVLGVIINDSLILLDRYNNMRKANPDHAVIAVVSGAMQYRFRAVFITSLTTILGLSPLLYERSEELLNVVPFAVSMIGGLIFSGLFTLFILPTLTMLIDTRYE